MRNIHFAFYALFFCLSIGCNIGSSTTEELSAILQINENHRTAHMNGDADLFVSQMADTITTIQDGQVYINSRQDTYNRFSTYFNRVKYAKWDDTQPPSVRLSPDGKMATLIAQKEIQAGMVSESEPIKYDTSQWAWMASFIKDNDEWKLYAISSGKAQ